MGWISERAMQRGNALYSGGPKRKGPLKRVVCVLHGDYGTNLFGSDTVLLECGHLSRSYGGMRAICAKCKEGEAVKPLTEWHITNPLLVHPGSLYVKSFKADELAARTER